MPTHSTTNRLAGVLAYCADLERERQRKEEESRQQKQKAREQKLQEREQQQQDVVRRLVARKRGEPEERVIPQPKKKVRQDYVYVIRASNGYYKIGISFNPHQRFKDLQRDAATWAIELELIHVIESKNAYGLEQSLHKRFAEQRVNGEWFLLTTPDVEWLQAQ
jgi:plasmid stabilization system protein ParE